MAKELKRKLLMEASKYNPEKSKIGGWFMSEKLDGCRAFWDGGLTRGVRTHSVPWAGLLHPKTGQPKSRVKPVSTGLWSRYGNPVNAPDWFLNQLPCCFLDGELWAGRGKFQRTTSIISKHQPVDAEWKEVQFGVFGAPPVGVFAEDGLIKHPNQWTDVRGVQKWLAALTCDQKDHFQCSAEASTFQEELYNISAWVDNYSDVAFMIKQTMLPEDDEEAAEIVATRKLEIISAMGEGLFLRHPASCWVPRRAPTGLKVKGCDDDEAIITGFTCGRETDKGSKLLGKIGSLIVDYKGQRLELAGLTNEERMFDSTPQILWATNNPGDDMPAGTQGRHFKTGEQVSFLYRELSVDGIPKDARYFRKRAEK